MVEGDAPVIGRTESAETLLGRSRTRRSGIRRSKGGVRGPARFRLRGAEECSDGAEDSSVARGVTSHIALVGVVCLLLLGYTDFTHSAKSSNSVSSTDSTNSSGVGPLLVDRDHPLDPGFAPSSLVDVEGVLLAPEAAADLADLLAHARTAGVGMTAVSGYRPYAEQAGLLERYTTAYGAIEAGRISAPAGASEHQTGLAVDIGSPDHACALQACFAGTPAGAWAAEHAWRYGFIIRYPAGTEAITGYTYEPWHLRWVGADTAADMRERGVALLEEYLQ